MPGELYRYAAHEIQSLLREQSTTAVEVAKSYLDRIDQHNDELGAYLHVWRDEALARAASIDERLGRGEAPGPLAGVPILLKDNLCTTLGTTSCGSKILDGFRSPYNATVTERLLSAGAVLMGKANMDEFAMGSSTENSGFMLTRNPWDMKRVPGGSSGGATAAVAADLAAVSLGSDTGGSIRQPAALCGCVGMKPTYGRVSRYGLVAFASSLDQIGPITKDVEDCALLLNVLCGKDPRDATSTDLAVPNFCDSLRDDVSGLRIGLPKEYYTSALGDEMREQIERAVGVLREQGATTVDVSLPHTDYAIAVYYIICTAEASANLARFDGVRYGFRHPDARNVHEMYTLSKSEGFGPEVKRRIMLGTYVLSSGYYDAYYLKAQKVRTLIRRDFDEAFEHCDLIVTPTTPTPAFKLGEKMDDPLQMYLNDVYTSSANLAGIPGVSIPCGWTESGLPVGLQLLGRSFDEETLIRTAYTYQCHRGFERKEAPLV